MSELEELKIKIVELTNALEESIKLQSHYAGLLNCYDGGCRIQFKSIDEWIERIKKLPKIAKYL